MAKLENYHTDLINDLKDIEMSKLYIGHALNDEDPEMFFFCLKNVLEARGLDQDLEELGITPHQFNSKIMALSFNAGTENLSLSKA